MLRRCVLFALVTIMVLGDSNPEAEAFTSTKQEDCRLRGARASRANVDPSAARATIRVPSDVSDLQDAINSIHDGGVIELAEGVYAAPAGGFKINDLGKGFVIRAAKGATVLLDGGGAYPVLRFMNSSVSYGKRVIFENLTFANGNSQIDGIAGGVTLQRAEATFDECSFQNNFGNQSSAGGGGTVVGINSSATFVGCSWNSNRSQTYGAGLAIGLHSEVDVHNSRFTNNRTNLPGHSPVAAGGGIHVSNSSLRVYGSYFEGNQAGYVGGAVYAIGTWADPVSVPQSFVTISDSTFTNNCAVRDPSVSFHSPTEAGAFHAEDQTTALIDNSEFVGNSANTGGAINLYRAKVRVSGSMLRGNRATGAGSGNGFGAAFSAISSDSTADGSNNRRSAHLEMTDSIIQGNSVVGQVGGGVYAAGDFSRTYGTNGVSQMGTAADNRATVVIKNVIFDDTDVEELPGIPGTGHGGAVLVDHAALTMRDVIVMYADAIGGSNGSGGGIAIINQSAGEIVSTAIAGSTAGRFGGALFVQGSSIYLTDCTLIGNEISQVENRIYGAAIFAAPDDGRGLPATGIVEDCVISNNVGLPIFDDDRDDGPVNDVRYNNNTIYSETFGDETYRNSLAGYKTTSELNSLIIKRANGTTTPKSQSPNFSAEQRPSVGAILAIPSSVVPETLSTYNLGYAWSGGSATLNSDPVSDKAAVIEISESGLHVLRVDGVPFTAEIIELREKTYVPLIVSGP